MLLEEFDVDKYERTLREEGKEEGREEGKEEGKEEGREEGIEKSIGMVKSFTDSKQAVVHQLMEHYKLSEDEAAAKVELYW